jgi:hypothetical protein
MSYGVKVMGITFWLLRYCGGRKTSITERRWVTVASLAASQRLIGYRGRTSKVEAKQGAKGRIKMGKKLTPYGPELKSLEVSPKTVLLIHNSHLGQRIRTIKVALPLRWLLVGSNPVVSTKSDVTPIIQRSSWRGKSGFY